MQRWWLVLRDRNRTMNHTMLGAVLHGARDLRVESCAIRELRPGQVLIRVRRAGICGSDLHYYNHGYCAAFVPTRPFILGHEMIGEVAARAEAAMPCRPAIARIASISHPIPA